MKKSTKRNKRNTKRKAQTVRTQNHNNNNNNHKQSQLKQVAQLPSPCTIKYSAVLADPFQPVSGACIPDVISTPSLKVRTLMRGNFSAGTTGVAFITVNPHIPSNDGTFGYYSNTSYAGTTIDATVGTGKVAYTNSQGPFAAADFGSTSHQGRLVGCGLRVRYVGTSVNMGGKMVMIREPLNVTLSGYDMDACLAHQEVDSYTVSRQWRTVCYRPMTADMIRYWSTAAPSFAVHCMACLITGTTASNPFEYQVVAYHEYTGASYGTSTSHSDPAGMGHVRNQVPPSSAGSTSIWQRVVKGISSVMNGHLLSTGVKFIQNKAWNYAKDVVMGLGQNLLEGVGETMLLTV